jgi:putative restriction endonuclease
VRKAFVGVTDKEWFDFLSARPELPEINFWQPGGRSRFRALQPGDLFLFKLHSPNNVIAGGGFFATSSLLPVSLAWETFGLGNGVKSLWEMRSRIEKYRRSSPQPAEDYTIGNIILEHPFFFRREEWIPMPSSFRLNTVRGKTYDLDSGEGLELGALVEDRFHRGAYIRTTSMVAEPVRQQMFSDPVLTRRRLGQGAFRVMVTDIYDRKCAITREHTLPVLQAAHIRPVSRGGEHRVSNGLLLRSDVHTLFDRGYVTVTPAYEFKVSQRLNADWQNGKIYYALDGQRIELPREKSCRPDPALLDWHEQTVFLK